MSEVTYLNLVTDEIHQNGRPGDVSVGPEKDFRISSRDLLSFAWQICKGMSYLSDMKVRISYSQCNTTHRKHQKVTKKINKN